MHSKHQKNQKNGEGNHLEKNLTSKIAWEILYFFPNFISRPQRYKIGNVFFGNITCYDKIT